MFAVSASVAVAAGSQGVQSSSIHGYGVVVSALVRCLQVRRVRRVLVFLVMVLLSLLLVQCLQLRSVCSVLMLGLWCWLCSLCDVCGCARCSECWVLLVVFAVSLSLFQLFWVLCGGFFLLEDGFEVDWLVGVEVPAADVFAVSSFPVPSVSFCLCPCLS